MTDQNADSDVTAHRRTILRGVAGATGALALGGAATGTAVGADLEERVDGIDSTYATTDAVRRAVDGHAGDLLETLSSDGVVEAGDSSALPLGDRLDRSAFAAGESGFRVSGVVERGTPTARIAVARRVDDGLLWLYVHPEDGRSYATVKPGVDEGATRVIASSGDGTTADVGTRYSVYSICRYSSADGGSCEPATLYCYPNDCYIIDASGSGCTECYLNPCDIYCGYP